MVYAIKCLLEENKSGKNRFKVFNYVFLNDRVQTIYMVQAGPICLKAIFLC